MATKKMQDGGPSNTSGRMTRLGNKITKKSEAGKTVSTGLQRRYDKAVDKVIIKQLKKSTDKPKKLKAWSNDDTIGNSGFARKGGVKMAKGGIAKRLPKANNGTITSSSNTPVTEAEKKKLQTTWEQRNKRPLPAGSELVASSDNFRTGAGGYSVYIKPVKKSKMGGAKMAKGGVAKKLKKYQSNGQVNEDPAWVGPDNYGRHRDSKWYGYDPKTNTFERQTYAKEMDRTNYKPTARDILNTITNPKLNIPHYQHWGNPYFVNFDKKGGTKMSKGGASKAKRFAALAPPYDKATAADRIAGATGKKPKLKDGGNWIQGAIKKPGALREQLHVKEGKKIPKVKLAAAAKKGGKLGQRARLAITLSKMHKK